ncbi:hypothetical protein [Tsukamurella strandjordii]|uniref:Uncharacterized protein n=1 Tax=Tsukamurella strandjordii TaxID=147577 RepID=A0AA90SSD2_9ACTN|nr:hypothetical protein [Tsukamurella strandjordii]MDP0399786.1 hypothetical protein [Tsukamurella strandjordii]
MVNPVLDNWAWVPVLVTSIAALGSATSATFAVLVYQKQRRTAVRDKFIDIVSELIDGLLQFAEISRVHAVGSTFMHYSRRNTSKEWREVSGAIEKLRILESSLNLDPESEMEWLLFNANNLAANVHQVDIAPRHRLRDFDSGMAARLRPTLMKDDAIWDALQGSSFYGLGTLGTVDSPNNADGIYDARYLEYVRTEALSLLSNEIEYDRGEAAARLLDSFVTYYLVPWSKHVVATKLR